MTKMVKTSYIVCQRIDKNKVKCDFLANDDEDETSIVATSLYLNDVLVNGSDLFDLNSFDTDMSCEHDGSYLNCRV